jgi:plasmid stability protein
MALIWIHYGGIRLPVTLSVKDVPDDLADALRSRARANRRSLQGELMAMIERHVGVRPFQAAALLGAIRRIGLATPDGSTRMVREDRDGR